MKKEINEILENLQLVPFTKGYRIEDFVCEICEYSEFLNRDALNFQELGVSKTHLLINKKNADIIAYMVLVTDSIRLSDIEKTQHNMDVIPFGAFPSLKIGKLAVDKKYQEEYKGIGSLMLEIARGLSHDVNELGIACKFITIDADVEHNPSVLSFYTKNGFKFNEKYIKKNKMQTVSMRLDIFNIGNEEIAQQTGTES